MRKFLNIFLVFLLLFSTAGMAISKHYCGELLQKITVTEDIHSCCGDEEMPEDCCSTEITFIQTEDFQLSQLNINLAFLPYILNIITFSFGNNGLEDPDLKRFYTYYKYPPPPGQNIVIQVQSFLI
ncbi:hypothetical protein BH23BAC1_BH23BAC1_30650 [soil metagenome]